ncbi:MAG: GNAT family N-acetyltransferase [Myxococcota bacterium]
MESAVPTQDVTIERAVPADAPAILALHRRVLEEGEWFITEPDELHEGVESKVAAIRDAQRTQHSAFFVARRQHLLVGWVHAVGGGRRRTRHVARVEMMVDDRHRGIGVGTALMRAVVAWAHQSSVVRKLSLNVFAHNTRAIALYRKFGFEEEGRREREYVFADGSFRADVLMAVWVK